MNTPAPGYPEYVPSAAIEVYERFWRTPEHGISLRMYDAAERLMTNPKAKPIFETLQKQSPTSYDWGFLLQAMIWPSLHYDEYKLRLKKDAEIYKKVLSDAHKKAVELAELLHQSHELINRSPDACFGSLDLASPLRLLRRSSKLVDAETRYRYQSYLEDKLLELQEEFDLKYWPRAEHLVKAIAQSIEEAQKEQNQGNPDDPILRSNKTSWRDHLALLVEELVAINSPEHRQNNQAGAPYLLRETDFCAWVDVVIAPSFPVGRNSVADALRKLQTRYPTALFLLKKQKK